MAIIHKATLSPSKLELIADYLPKQPWFIRRANRSWWAPTALTIPPVKSESKPTSSQPATASTRFPSATAATSLAGANDWLIGTMDHSVLGKRWVYDACADPVYIKALATAILTGQKEAEQFVDGESQPRPSTVSVQGTGMLDGGLPALSASAPVSGSGVTIIDAGSLRLKVNRVVEVAVDAAVNTAAAPELHTGWPSREPGKGLKTRSSWLR